MAVIETGVEWVTNYTAALPPFQHVGFYLYLKEPQMIRKNQAVVILTEDDAADYLKARFVGASVAGWKQMKENGRFREELEKRVIDEYDRRVAEAQETRDRFLTKLRS